MAISFTCADITFRLSDKTALKTFIATSFLSETGRKLNVSYIFCSFEYLLRINQDFLRHDYYTDIITFPLSETDRRLDAEIYISIDRVRDNAAQLKTPFDQELHRVLFHGVLHLMGYKDKTATQKAKMRQAEDKWLKAFAKEAF